MSIITNRVFKKFKKGSFKQRAEMINVLETQINDLKELLIRMKCYNE